MSLKIVHTTSQLHLLSLIFSKIQTMFPIRCSLWRILRVFGNRRGNFAQIWKNWHILLHLSIGELRNVALFSLLVHISLLYYTVCWSLVHLGFVNVLWHSISPFSSRVPNLTRLRSRNNFWTVLKTFIYWGVRLSVSGLCCTLLFTVQRRKQNHNIYNRKVVELWKGEPCELWEDKGGLAGPQQYFFLKSIFTKQ